MSLAKEAAVDYATRNANLAKGKDEFGIMDVSTAKRIGPKGGLQHPSRMTTPGGRETAKALSEQGHMLRRNFVGNPDFGDELRHSSLTERKKIYFGNDSLSPIHSQIWHSRLSTPEVGFADYTRAEKTLGSRIKNREKALRVAKVAVPTALAALTVYGGKKLYDRYQERKRKSKEARK